MIKKIFKQIWAERRHNSWILLELIFVFFMLLVITDLLWIKLKNYTEPKGFDINNTYVLNLKQLDPIAPGYVDPASITESSITQLNNIIERIRLYSDIEYISISHHARPYSMGGFWNGLRFDTIASNTGVRCRAVTPSYFDVFRIRSADGTPVRIDAAGYNQLVLTEDMAAYFFGDASRAIGQEIYSGGDEEKKRPYHIAAVSNLMKRQEFMPYEHAYFEIYTMGTFKDREPGLNAIHLDLCVRVKDGTAKHFESSFLSDMGDRLKENNLYVSSVIPSSKYRDDIVGQILRQGVRQQIYVMVFVLITVFMGVFGVFWLRTRQRRGEIGVRMAMGATKSIIRYAMIAESLCLMALCILPGLLAYINLLYSDILDTSNLAFSFGRIVLVFAVALLIMALIVAGGTAWPASRAASIQPVDALRDE